MIDYSDEGKKRKTKRNRKIVKNAKRRTNGIFVFKILVMGFMFLSTGFFTSKVANAVMNYDGLLIKEFVINDLNREIAPKVIDLCKKYRSNIFSLNCEDLKNEFLKIKLISSVNIIKRPPQKIEIELTYRKPAIQYYRKGRYVLMDRSGCDYAYYKKKKDNLDVPFIKEGFVKKNWKQYLQKMDLLKDINGIEYYGVSKIMGLYFKFRDSKELIYPPNKQAKKQLGIYFDIKKKILSQVDRIKVADLRFLDKIFVEYNGEVSNG